ncbi:MAG: type II toxin-antitoxin system Phd/YefM family antitoxin [Hydrogenophilales bacterium]|nr:type II toxin-antitoxin system Phd/YefM family antitoxin [Hydrogenophilales bacterium]
MHSWQLQEAKARFSEVVKSAVSEGPQVITLRGEPVAVLISAHEYARLTGHKPDFVEFLRQSQLLGAALEIDRDHSLVREIEL